MRRGQRGQALTELALVAPLFAILLLLFSFWARLALTRLALVQLSRDSALLLARNGELWSAPPQRQLEAVRELARRGRKLQPQSLELQQASLPLPTQYLGIETPALLQSEGAQALSGWFLGRRYTLRYRIDLGGLAGRVLPDGIVLSESMAVQGDPLKVLASRYLKAAYR